MPGTHCVPGSRFTPGPHTRGRVNSPTTPLKRRWAPGVGEGCDWSTAGPRQQHLLSASDPEPALSTVSSCLDPASIQQQKGQFSKGGQYAFRQLRESLGYQTLFGRQERGLGLGQHTWAAIGFPQGRARSASAAGRTSVPRAAWERSGGQGAAELAEWLAGPQRCFLQELGGLACRTARNPR